MTCFKVSTETVEMSNRKFWRAMGYDFLFKSTHEPEGQYLLDRGQKHGTIKYLRSHFTFDNSSPHADNKAGGNVCGQVMNIQEDGTVEYDFSIVNRTFQEYVRRGMKPIVEFDFFPDNICYTTEENANDEGFTVLDGIIKDWDLWNELLTKFMENLEETFGKEELKTWYFEVWNEPDGFSGKELQQFYKLYDVFANIVKSFDSAYRVGGPACYKLQVMKDFLDHVTSGTNHVTGEVGSPIDFVSFHIYGLSGGWLSGGPKIYPQVGRFSGDILWWQRLMRTYPSLEGVEMHLNEWGLCSHGDSKFVDKFPQLEYRNSEYSALFMVKLVDCLRVIEKSYDFPIDLMLFWGSSFNATFKNMFMGSRDLTTTGNVPKPILTGWEMLSRLGDEFLQVKGPLPGGRHGLMAAREDAKIHLIAYNFSEMDDDENREDIIKIELDQLSANKYRMDEIRLDHNHHNTYREWQRLGAEKDPDKEVIDKLMKTAELTLDSTSEFKAVDGKTEISITIPRHGMILMEIEAL